MPSRHPSRVLGTVRSPRTTSTCGGKGDVSGLRTSARTWAPGVSAARTPSVMLWNRRPCMLALEPGQIILHYRIVEKIGQGGMGVVYKAEDQKLGRLVAIKALPATATSNETARMRLVREARSASALNHPNIVTIHSIDDAEDFTFVVMEYIAGETLGAA